MKRIFQFLSVSGMGGLEHMVANISTLVKGYDFTCVSPKGTISKYFDKLHIKHINVRNINPFSVRRIVKKYKPDIVQGHDVKASLSLACNAHLCHKYDIKIISQIHNDDPRMWKHFGLRSLLYAISAPFYDNVVVVSNPIYQNYVYRNLIKNKVSVIYNVINPFIINSLLTRHHVNKKWDCIFVGRMARQKDPLKFVYIIYDIKKRVHDIKAVMVGNGPLMNSVKDTIHNLHLDNNISIVGFSSNPYKYVQRSKISLVTSNYEGFGLVALESLIIGVPVITTYVGGLKDIITKGCGDFANTYKDFSRKVIELLNNEDKYNNKCLGAKARSHHINNIKKFSKLYSKVYDS